MVPGLRFIYKIEVHNISVLDSAFMSRIQNFCRESRNFCHVSKFLSKMSDFCPSLKILYPDLGFMSYIQDFCPRFTISKFMSRIQNFCQKNFCPGFKIFVRKVRITVPNSGFMLRIQKFFEKDGTSIRNSRFLPKKTEFLSRI